MPDILLKLERMKTESTLLALAIIATLIMLIPISGGSELLMIDLSLLSGIYFCGSFYFFSDRGKGTQSTHPATDTVIDSVVTSGSGLKFQNIGLSVAAGVALSIVVVGFQFFILALAGAKEMLIIGLPAILVILIIALIQRNAATSEMKVYYRNMVIRLTFWFIVGLVGFFVSYEEIIKIKTRNDPELGRLEILRHHSKTDDEYHKYQKQINDYHRRQDSLEQAK